MIISKIILTVIPICTWSYLVRNWLYLRKKWKEQEIFRQRHDCVVMFDTNRGVVNYPYWKKSATSINENSCEPVLYFIQTARKSIDVALMTISSEYLINALLDAHERGVKIRLVVDFYYKTSVIKKLTDNGIPVHYYVCPFGHTQSIFHYKYAVKDYSCGKGYLCQGSINWVNSSFVNNYEHLVFSSDSDLVRDFYENFESSWKLVSDLKKNNYTVRAILNECRY